MIFPSSYPIYIHLMIYFILACSIDFFDRLCYHKKYGYNFHTTVA